MRELAPLCPYDGFPFDQRVQGPAVAGIVTEPFLERAQVERYNEAGFTVARSPAPVYRCATCARETTRRVCMALHLAPGRHPALQFTGEYRAECGACAGVPRALQAPEPPAPWETRI